MLLSSIAPRSISFRPTILPRNAKIEFSLNSSNRSDDCDVSFDGKVYIYIHKYL